MKIKSYEIFRCDAGWRLFSFLEAGDRHRPGRLVGIQ